MIIDNDTYVGHIIHEGHIFEIKPLNDRFQSILKMDRVNVHIITRRYVWPNLCSNTYSLYICLQEIQIISFLLVNMAEKLRCCQLDLGFFFYTKLGNDLFEGIIKRKTNQYHTRAIISCS